MNEAVSLSNLIWEGERAPLAKALIAAQKSSEAIKKANENLAFKSKYADLAAVVEAVVPALNSAGVGVIQSPSFDGEHVAVETMLLHESGVSVTSVLRLRPSKLDAQGVGSAITYARRYSLLAMTGAAPEDDDGNAASGPRQQATQPPAQTQRAEPKAPTLADRTKACIERLNTVESAADLEKAWGLAGPLRNDLDRSDPEKLTDLETLFERRHEALSPKKLEAAE